ncbi:MAG: hypothetical protein NC548_27300 [Lachnospiraceae bacterium]|nr:hypothetical protein [Lachnospiraceae bacterium]
MAINILKDNYQKDGLDAMQIEIANGDLAALKEATEKYGVHDITDMMAFAIGVLNKADGGPVAVVDEGGRFTKFIPSKAITKDGSERK